MTGPVTTEALVEDLRASHLAAIDACLRASETTGEVPQGLRLREREAAAALISTLLAALQQVTAERDEARADLKAAEDSNDALNEKLSALAPHGSCACSYDKPGDVCMHHSPALATATSELARLRAEGEAKDRALRMFVRIADVWPLLTPEQADDRIEGAADVARTALARAATAREGA